MFFRDFMQDEQPEYKRQLEFIIKQLNGRNDVATMSAEDSDDEGDEDDDEVTIMFWLING